MTAFPPPPHVLVIGDLGAAEMAPVCDWLSQWPAVDHQRIVWDLRAARRIRDDGEWFPDLVLVCQTWPDQFSGVDVHALLTLFPLARLCCCHGAWCLSDDRTRHTWPLAVRIPVDEAAARLRSVWEQLSLSRPDPQLPLTASRAEVYADAISADWLPPAVPTSVRVDSPDPWLERLWQSVLSRAGYHVVADRSQTQLIVFDLDPWPARQFDWQQVARESPQARVVGLAGFRQLPPQESPGSPGWPIGRLTTIIDKLAPLPTALEFMR